MGGKCGESDVMATLFLHYLWVPATVVWSFEDTLIGSLYSVGQCSCGSRSGRFFKVRSQSALNAKNSVSLKCAKHSTTFAVVVAAVPSAWTRKAGQEMRRVAHQSRSELLKIDNIPWEISLPALTEIHICQ